MILGLALGLAGCTALGTSESQSAPVVTSPSPSTTAAPPPVTTPRPPARPPQPSTASAWKPLVQKAKQATARGDYEQALALLERAQRIDPESGEIYLQLARTHLSKGDDAQAMATAERGMLFCRGNTQCDALRAFSR